MSIKFMRNFGLVCAVFLLAACDKPQVDETSEGPPVAASEPSPAPAEGTVSSLNLDGDGLRLIDSNSGGARAVEFGTNKTEFLEMLEKVTGKPAVKQGNNEDCGATNAVWSDGLITWFQAERFVGWSISEDQASTLRTANGIGLGMTRTELENSGTVVQVTESSIGIEFSAGNVAGLLNSSNADANISNMWAGQVCIAR
ncbi:hypothetical protein [Limnobacter parvus]|uniref:Uncharacterized protein n=1 Tax=Limnobacter parvus TaxID=2939690 RepID=A0ABT1XH10_9BURK|nr:hypothetical protein [Limnobacter parvus]MCR2746578.1 hypothetical protein [Limnobacter parvus]